MRKINSKDCIGETKTLNFICKSKGNTSSQRGIRVKKKIWENIWSKLRNEDQADKGPTVYTVGNLWVWAGDQTVPKLCQVPTNITVDLWGSFTIIVAQRMLRQVHVRKDLLVGSVADGIHQL